MWKFENGVFKKYNYEISTQEIETVLNVCDKLIGYVPSVIAPDDKFDRIPINDYKSIKNVQLHDDEHSEWYYLEQLSKGQLVYSDRNYTFTDIPSYLNGKYFMQPPNDSKYFKDQKVLVEFDIDKGGTLWLAVQRQESFQNYPKWLYDEGWSIANVISRQDGLDIHILGRDSHFGLFKKIVHKNDHIELEIYSELENMWILVFGM